MKRINARPYGIDPAESLCLERGCAESQPQQRPLCKTSWPICKPCGIFTQLCPLFRMKPTNPGDGSGSLGTGREKFGCHRKLYGFRLLAQFIGGKNRTGSQNCRAGKLNPVKPRRHPVLRPLVFRHSTPALFHPTLPIRMSLVRILVDGYSLLHSWPELAPGKARFSAAARDELIHILTLYRDVNGTPITIFFDGSSPKLGGPLEIRSTPEVEILFSKAGQTADQMIERAAHRFKTYGEVLAVTDDIAERETVINMGGLASSCWNFIQTVQNTLVDLQDEIKHHNRREQNRFKRRT